MNSSASTAHLLPIHRGLMAAVGPEGLADLIGPPTARETEMVAGFADRIAGMDPAELAARYGITPDLREAIDRALS